MRMRGEAAVVAGAGSGLGRATVLRPAAEGPVVTGVALPTGGGDSTV